MAIITIIFAATIEISRLFFTAFVLINVLCVVKVTSQTTAKKQKLAYYTIIFYFASQVFLIKIKLINFKFFILKNQSELVVIMIFYVNFYIYISINP